MKYNVTVRCSRCDNEQTFIVDVSQYISWVPADTLLGSLVDIGTGPCDNCSFWAWDEDSVRVTEVKHSWLGSLIRWLLTPW